MATPGRRLRHLARILRGERDVTAATRRALDVLLSTAATALRASGYDTSVLDSRLPGWRQALDKDVTPAVLRVFTQAWEATADGTLIDPEPYATRHIEAVHNRLVAVSDEVFDTMRLTLEEGRQNGEAIADLASRVEVLLADEQRWTNRAVTIARTEVIGANNAGATASAAATAETLGVSAGLVVKEWMATSDSRTRDTHKRADGKQVMGMDTTFNVGRADLLHPGDPHGRPEEVINCRCTVIFYYPGDPDYPASLSDGQPAGEPARFPAARGVGEQPAAAQPLAPAARTPAARAAEPVVDAGPQSTMERMARALTVQELEMETRRGSPAAKKAARAELRRRGLAASASRNATENEALLTAADQEDPMTDTAPEAETPLDEPTHAGMAVQAADTGRVLLQQRSLDPEDAPEVRGTWEFPGGGLEDGEEPLAGAIREFTEETGLVPPPGEVTGGWRSANGVYQGFVHTTPVEAAAFPELNPDAEAAETVNPDDPQKRNPDVTAWFTLEQMQDLGSALRPEVYNTDWTQFAPTPQEVEMPTDDTAQAALAAAATKDQALEAALAAVRQAGYAVNLTAAEGDEETPLVTPEPTEVTGPDAEEMGTDGQSFYGIIWPENVQSGDGRGIESGATTWRDLPLPIMAQDAQAPGHDGAVRVGRLDSMERDDTTYTVPVIRYAGVWDTSESAVETARQVDQGMVRGISTDGDAVTVELRDSAGGVLDPMTDDFPEDGVVMEVATAARVSGGTVCSIPAFHQAYIANGTLADRVDPEPGWNEDRTPKDNTLDAGTVSEDEGAPLVASAGQARRAPVWTITAGASVLPVVEGRYFSNPGLTEATNLTVDDDGRVYGHLAAWGTCHIGIDGYCQEPPVSASNYAFYAKGTVLTDAGERVRVGPLTMGTGHAPMGMGYKAAAEHYDNTGTVVADVTIGQDGVGIWFSGRVRPTATPDQVFALSAAGAVSGDWREVARHSGDLELVAALVVNVPGFAIQAPSVAASAETGLSMVAAGMVRPPAPSGPAVTDLDHRAIAAAVVAHLDRREKVRTAASRLTARRALRRADRVAAASARINERV